MMWMNYYLKFWIFQNVSIMQGAVYSSDVKIHVAKLESEDRTKLTEISISLHLQI